jgi:hydrogenase expression/formation protein HypE
MPPRPLPAGKLPGALLAELVATLPPGDPAVRLGPALGEDAAVIDVEAGALVAATDPITLTASEAGRYAVLINANDVAVCGVPPRWFLTTVLLPPGTTDDDVRALLVEVLAALDEVGAVLVGGHTEVTDAVTAPVVVGQMLGHAPDGEVVTTAGAASGEAVVQIGPAPVEGAAVLAAEAAGQLTHLDAEVVRAAAGAAADPGISVVAAALRAAELGATAMHDPTEGGLAAGLHELASASQVGLDVEAHAIAWYEPGVAVCRALDCDPWATLASGCVLATFPAVTAEAVTATLAEEGHPAAVIGRVTAGDGVRVDGAPLPWPARDELARRLSE